jgi:hypothetical protein
LSPLEFMINLLGLNYATESKKPRKAVLKA